MICLSKASFILLLATSSLYANTPPIAVCPPDVGVASFVDTVVTPPASVIDPDTGDTHTWSLVSVTPIYFGELSVDPNTGAVQFILAPEDHSVFAEWEVCISVTDGIDTDVCCLLITSLNCRACDCCVVPGDASADGLVNIGDVTFLIQYIFNGGPSPRCCESADFTGSGEINIRDITGLIDYIFKSGLPPECSQIPVLCSPE